MSLLEARGAAGCRMHPTTEPHPILPMDHAQRAGVLQLHELLRTQILQLRRYFMEDFYVNAEDNYQAQQINDFLNMEE